MEAGDARSLVSPLMHGVAPGPQGPVYDVRGFGAVGDGVTDDAVAVQRAIDASTAGGTVLFPPGRYRVAHTLYYHSGMRFAGDVGSAIVQACDVLFDRPAQGFVGRLIFDGLTITRGDSVPDDYQNRSGQANAVIAVKGYCHDPVTGIVIRDCTFHDIAGRAVFLKGVSGLRVENSHFINIYDAIECGGSGDASNYETHGVRDLCFISNTFANVSTGIVLQGLSDVRLGQYKPAGLIEDVVVADNRFTRTIFIGVECYCFNRRVEMHSNVFKDSWGASLSAKLSKSISIHHNIAPQILVQGETNATYDFALDDVLIEGNIVEGNTAVAVKKGIMVWRQGSNVVIRNNIVRGHATGICIGRAARERVEYPTERQVGISVLGNICHDNTSLGIHTLEAESVMIADNRAYDNGETAGNSGMGHRVDGVLTNTWIRNEWYEDTSVGAARKQAVGVYVTPGAIGAGTSIVNVLARNNKNMDVYNPAAVPIHTDLDRGGPSTARPHTPAVGTAYFDTTLRKALWYDGTAWVDATGRAV